MTSRRRAGDGLPGESGGTAEGSAGPGWARGGGTAAARQRQRQRHSAALAARPRPAAVGAAGPVSIRFLGTVGSALRFRSCTARRTASSAEALRAARQKGLCDQARACLQAAEGKEIPGDKLHSREDAQMFKQINQARICKILGGKTEVLRRYPTTCHNYASRLALYN